MAYSTNSTPPWNGLGSSVSEIQDTRRLPGFFKKFLNKSRQAQQPSSNPAISSKYKSPGINSTHSTAQIILVPLDEARYTYLDSNRSFDEVDYYQTGIRGIQHYSRELESARHWGECYLELVTEPNNKHDSNAVKVVLNGQRIGYLGASIAEFFHGFVLGFQRAGKRVYAPGMVYKPHNGVIVIPTISKMIEILQAESSQPINKFWEELPSELKARVIDNNYHFDRETAKQLSLFHTNFPLYTPYETKAPEEAIPIVLERFLKELRIAHRREAEQKRTRRNAEMAGLAASGMTYREIGEKYDLKPSTVGQIVRDLRSAEPESFTVSQNKNAKSAAIEIKRKYQNLTYSSTAERNTAIMQMKSEGLTLQEIGDIVGLKRDTVKKIAQKMRKDS